MNLREAHDKYTTRIDAINSKNCYMYQISDRLAYYEAKTLAFKKNSSLIIVP